MLRKKYVIPNVLSRFVSINAVLINLQHLELNTLFIYNAILVEIHSTLVSQILIRYNSESWWAWLQIQIRVNRDLQIDAAIFLFMLDSPLLINADLYLAPHL